MDLDVIIKAFDEPDETRTFEKGRFEIVRLGGISLGRATYEPGWKWSEHVGPLLGETYCNVGHLGVVLTGTAVAAFEDGEVVELRRGCAFHIPPVPHGSWVVGAEEYQSLHLMGAEEYAAG